MWLLVAVFPNVTTTNGSDLNLSIAGMPRALTIVIRRNFAMVPVEEGTAISIGACG